MPNVIKINDVTLDASAGSPISFYGKLSGKMLSGIDISFHVSGPRSVEPLISRETVQVTNPFAEQTYPPSLKLISSSYTDGRPEHYYPCEIRALDIAPEFKVLEIEGDEFPVLACREEAVAEQDQEGI